MEIMIMAILSPQLRCEWRLESYQVALMSSVRKPTPRECLRKLENVRMFSFWPQVVFLAIGIGAPIWGTFCDKYGRRNVSLICVLSWDFSVRFIDLTGTSLFKTGGGHFHLRRTVFWPPERLCSHIQLVLVPTVPRRHRDRGNPSGVGSHLHGCI